MPIDDALQELKKEVLTPVKTQPNPDSLAYIKQETDKALGEICNIVDKKVKSFLESAIDLDNSFDMSFELEGSEAQIDADRKCTFRIENETICGYKSAYFFIKRKTFRPTIEWEFIDICFSSYKNYKKVEAGRTKRTFLGIPLGEKIIYDKVPDCGGRSFSYEWTRGDTEGSVLRKTYAKGDAQVFFQRMIEQYYYDPRTVLALLKMLNRAPDTVHEYFAKLRDSSKELKL